MKGATTPSDRSATILRNNVLLSLLLVLISSFTITDAFVSPTSYSPRGIITATTTTTKRQMALDPVTYLRTEWVSAALVTNQTPGSADKVLELGCEDGRIVNFVPRTVREIITSSAENPDSPEGGGLTVSCSRQLKQQAERRGAGALMTYSNQRADDLSETPSSSIDIVVSLQSAQRMKDNGLDWKKSIREAGRVLKPGGRFLFCEAVDVGGDSYLDFVNSLSDFSMENKTGDDDEEGSEVTETVDTVEEEDSDDVDVDVDSPPAKSPIFQEVGYDQVDMVLQPHIAGIAIKAMDADMTPAEKAQKKAEEESERLGEMTLNAFEGRSKRRRKKKKKTETDGM